MDSRGAMEYINPVKKNQRMSFTMQVRSHKVVRKHHKSREGMEGPTLLQGVWLEIRLLGKRRTGLMTCTASEIQFVVANANFTGQLHRCFYGLLVRQTSSKTTVVQLPPITTRISTIDDYLLGKIVER